MQAYSCCRSRDIGLNSCERWQPAHLFKTASRGPIRVCRALKPVVHGVDWHIYQVQLQLSWQQGAWPPTGHNVRCLASGHASAPSVSASQQGVHQSTMHGGTTLPTCRSTGSRNQGAHDDACDGGRGTWPTMGRISCTPCSFWVPSPPLPTSSLGERTQQEAVVVQYRRPPA